LNEADRVLVLNVVNRHETDPVETEVLLQTGTFTGHARIREVNGASLEATNTKDREEVSIVTKDIDFKGNAILYSFPAHSLTQIEIPVKSL